MKTSFLSTLALSLAASFPASLVASFAGLHLPTLLDTTHTFGAFVTVLTLHTVCADYARRPATWLTLASRPIRIGSGPSTLAAAGTEERRLAA